MLTYHLADLPAFTPTSAGAFLRVDAAEWHAGRWWRGAEVTVGGVPYLVTGVTRRPAGEPVVLVTLARRPAPTYVPRPPGYNSPAAVARRRAASLDQRPRVGGP